MEKQNCWQFKKCGREPGGAKMKDLGICATAQTSALNGVHGGVNGGRTCWVVAGTLCGGTVQGSFAQKYANCFTCAFYKAVAAEEGLKFIQSTRLLALLRK